MLNFLNYCPLNILATYCLFVLHIPVIRPLWPADSKVVGSMQTVGPWGRILHQWFRAPSNEIGPASNTPIHSSQRVFGIHMGYLWLARASEDR